MSHFSNDQDDEPFGYVIHRCESSFLGDGRSFKVLLPVRLSTTLMKEEYLCAKAEIEAAQAKIDSAREERNKPKWPGPVVSVKRTAALPVELKVEEWNEDDDPTPEAEANRHYSKPRRPGTDYKENEHYPVYAPDQAINLLRLAKQTSSEDLKERDKNLYKQLRKLGPLRKISNPYLREDFNELFEKLNEKHPHFNAVIDLVKKQVELAGISRKPIRIPPILLFGPPGVGKSHFAEDMAKTLGANCLRIPMDSSASRLTMLGSDRRYSNTSFGVIFNLVCLGEQANPIVMLDEIDKADQSGHGDTLKPLHGMLEPATSKRVRDASIEMEFDVSMVTWIATANHVELIPISLRSRFREFLIMPPTGEQAIQVSMSVINDVMSSNAPNSFQKASRKIGVALAHLTAREIRQAAEQGVANAVSKGGLSLQVSDLPLEALALDDNDIRNKQGGNLLH